MITPDGVRYLSLAKARKAARPFRYRWLVPIVCGTTDPRRWQIAAVAGVVATAVGTALLAPTWQSGVAAGLMVAALPSMRFGLRAPVLVDAPAMALAVACAVASHYGAPIYVVAVLALVAGSAKETAPIFAALFAWSPWPLVGLLAPLAALRIIADGPDVLDAHNAWILEHPLRASWKFHKGHLLDGAKFLAPWGGAVAGFAHLDWQLAAVLAAAYGQVVVATDTVRLYQWAAPVMCVAAATAVPTAWLPLLVLATIWNPLAGDGI